MSRNKKWGDILGNFNYTEQLKNCLEIQSIIKKYPLLNPIEDYVLMQEKKIKQSEEYKKALSIAKSEGIPYDTYELNDMEILPRLNASPILYTLFEMDAFPEVLTEHLMGCFIHSQYWHITGLPDNVNDMLPINIISIDENTDSHKHDSIAEAYLSRLPFMNATGVAKKFEIYTKNEKISYDISDLPASTKKIWNIIRQTTKEWYQIALPIVKENSDIKYPWEISQPAWNAAPASLREKHIKAVRKLACEVWEWHNKQQTNRQNEPIGRCLSAVQNNLIETNASMLFHNFRSSFSTPYNLDENNGLHTADLSNEKQTMKAMAQLRPNHLETGHYLGEGELVKWQQRMAELVMSMGDLTADVLDIISAAWINQATHPGATVDITADDFLVYRGLQPQKSGTGRRGGFKNEARKQIARQILILENMWLIVSEMTAYEEFETKNGKRRKPCKWQGESRVIIVSSRVRQVKLDGTTEEPFAWRIGLGDCLTYFLLGLGRQTALLSQKALNYDPLKQKWEKRLTRYLSWLWRINSQSDPKPLTVSTIITKGIMENVNIKNPSRTKERFEKALDQLVSDNVISAWQYENENESIVGQHGWITNWLQWKVVVKPPQVIIDQYAKIVDQKNKITKQIQKDSPGIVELMITGAMLKEKRLLLKLTQLQAAEEIGISRPRISRIESSVDKSIITKPELKKLAVWFKK